MALETTLFRDLAYVFGAAVVGGGVAKALRQPSMNTVRVCRNSPAAR